MVFVSFLYPLGRIFDVDAFLHNVCYNAGHAKHWLAK